MIRTLIAAAGLAVLAAGAHARTYTGDVTQPHDVTQSFTALFDVMLDANIAHAVAREGKASRTMVPGAVVYKTGEGW